jgi:thymidylate synthase
MAHQSVIDMTNPCVCLTGRKLSEAFRFAEAAWILSGDNRVSTIAPFSEKIAQFSDDGHRYFGSYGPKVVDQLSYCAQKLQLDSESRQAVINIWRENPGQTRDVPCTLSLQFLIRQGRLNIVATMRSSDAWLGWPYDVFNFSMIGWAMCLYLRDLRGPGRSEEGLPSPGVLFLTAGSQHLYQTNLTQAEEVLEHGKVFRPRISLPPFEEWVTSSKGQNLVDDFVRDLWILANSAHR